MPKEVIGASYGIFDILGVDKRGEKVKLRYYANTQDPDEAKRLALSEQHTSLAEVREISLVSKAK